MKKKSKTKFLNNYILISISHIDKKNKLETKIIYSNTKRLLTSIRDQNNFQFLTFVQTPTSYRVTSKLTSECNPDVP